MSTLKVSSIQHASAASAAIALASDGTATLNGLAYGALSGRNRIINGDMRIDQRNAGTVNPTSADGLKYTVDRWFVYNSTASSKLSVQKSTEAPTGFSNSYLVTSTSAYALASGDEFSIGQYIEGFNFSDLAWGTAGAQAVTLSFWVRSSLTGTFGGSLMNNAYNRSYPFSYSISSANTWERKTITVAGDTTGTWVGATNGIGLRVILGIGVGSNKSGTAGAWAGAEYESATGATSVVGTNGATFYITGVQLEAGTVATPFEQRSYGQELALCQRYYQLSNTAAWAANQAATHYFKVTMRATPTLTTNPSGGAYVVAPVIDTNSFYAVYNVQSGFAWTASIEL